MQWADTFNLQMRPLVDFSPISPNMASAATPPLVHSGPVPINTCRVWVLIAFCSHCRAAGDVVPASRSGRLFVEEPHQAAQGQPKDRVGECGSEYEGDCEFARCGAMGNLGMRGTDHMGQRQQGKTAELD